MLPKAPDRRTVTWVCWFPKDPSAALPRESPQDSTLLMQTVRAGLSLRMSRTGMDWQGDFV